MFAIIIPVVLIVFAFFTFLNWAEKEFGDGDSEEPYNDDRDLFI